MDMILQDKQESEDAKQFFKWMLNKDESEPRKVVTDKLGSSGEEHRDLSLFQIACVLKNTAMV
jgi:transposase-like protein